MKWPAGSLVARLTRCKSVGDARARARRSVVGAARTRRAEGGFALIVVLLVLLALLVLCTPFLLSARNADRASAQLADRTEGRLGLDAAARHARHVLGDSHSAVDTTPYWDTLEEIEVSTRFDPGFLDPNDPAGSMWDVEPTDLSGLIDLDSCSPFVIANLIGASTRFTEAIEAGAKALPLSSTAGLAPSGYVWASGELIRYAKIEDGKLTGVQRGVLGPGSSSDWRGGPRPDWAHAAGSPVIDQRALAFCLWRMNSATGEPAQFDSYEALQQAAGFALSGATEGAVAAAHFSEDVLRPVLEHGTVHGGIRAAEAWRHPTRLIAQVEGGKDGILRVDSRRWINAGTTLQISDGQTSELALVQDIGPGGEVRLDRILTNDYEPYRAIVRVLARRPVNLNTATSEVLRALFANLQVQGRNTRITKDEAGTLADLVIESRPFEGFEDFLRRIVLPAGGLAPLPTDAPVFPAILKGSGGFIDDWDALALYTNGLDANDNSLAYSTMPFAFTSRDTYAFELRASVNAPSGVERLAIVRDEVDLVVPQRELFSLWARQEDFDEAIRLDGEAPWWSSGPNATWPWDGGAVPPSPRWAHLGPLARKTFFPEMKDKSSGEATEPEPTGEHVFPSRGETGWIQLWPSRVSEENDRLEGRVLHFDHETRDPEGRFLPDEVIAKPADDPDVVRWVGATGLMRPMALSMWVKPRSTADGWLFDVGGTSPESDRIELFFDSAKQDLVLRVRDGVGDHPDTTAFFEAGEARYSFASGATSPGLPVDVWHHVELDVRGTRPDQIHMLVNGLAHGVRIPGQTRLEAALATDSIVMTVESTEGFPEQGVVQIGTELIEYQLDAESDALIAAPQATGGLAGQGGRLAREGFHYEINGTGVTHEARNPPQAHPAGAAVRLYGYTTELESAVPIGNSPLPSPLGRFAVAIVTGTTVQGESNASGEQIVEGTTGTLLGHGIDGQSVLTEIELGPVIPGSTGTSGPENAFPANGGYVLLVQRWLDTLKLTAGPVQQTLNNIVTADGVRIGEGEILRYNSREGTRLRFSGATRGDQLGLQTPSGPGRDRRAFVVTWDTIENDTVDAIPFKDDISAKVFAIPISLPAAGAGNASTFLIPDDGYSEYAQITHPQDGELTEWVRYDEAVNNNLIRTSVTAVIEAYAAATTEDWGEAVTGTITVFPAPGLGGSPAPVVEPPATAAPQTTQPSALWTDTLGAEEPNEDPITRAVRTRMQIRGVLGTHTHDHAAGIAVLPVFRVDGGGATLDSGRPGTGDYAFLVGEAPDDLGSTVLVHHAIEPYDYVWWDWEPLEPDLTTPVAGTEPRVDHFNGDSPSTPQGGTPPADDVYVNDIYVGLAAAAKAPYSPASSATQGGATPGQGAYEDARLRARLVKHPSGELPRIVTRTTIGGGFSGAGAGAVPAAVVDEIVYGDAVFGENAPVTGAQAAEEYRGGLLYVGEDLDASSLEAGIIRWWIRIPRDRIVSDQHNYFDDLPQDAGLLRIGDEILAYNHLDLASGNVTLAPEGRGLLGTQPQFHHRIETISFLEQREVTFLTSDVRPGDALLPIAEAGDFPDAGTVLIGDELIHYTRKRSGALEMPRGSSTPGRMDEKGEGLFRGRYGTTAAAHLTGEAVVLMPFRYWDRWATRADAPELAYFAITLDQPNAFWSSFFFVKEDTESAQLGVLVRTDADAPWDADPENDPRLKVYYSGDEAGAPLPIGVQSDALEWRVFARYAPGAFNIEDGLAHGWRQTPRLSRLGAFYFGPGMVLRSVER